jgi:hypothetical protein
MKEHTDLMISIDSFNTRKESSIIDHRIRMLWLRRVVRDCGLPVETVKIKIDNRAALWMISSGATSEKTKHVDIQHHFIQERSIRKEVAFEACSTVEQGVDFLTKALGLEGHRMCKLKAGIKMIE